MTLRDEIREALENYVVDVKPLSGKCYHNDFVDACQPILAIFQKRLDEIRKLSFHSASFGLYEGDEEIKNLQQQLLYASQRFEKIAALCTLDEIEQDNPCENCPNYEYVEQYYILAKDVCDKCFVANMGYKNKCKPEQDEPEQDENKPKVDKAQIWKASDFRFWTLSECCNNHFITGDIIVDEIDRVVMWIDNASMGQFTDEIISDHCTYVGNYKDRIMELIKEHAE